MNTAASKSEAAFSVPPRLPVSPPGQMDGFPFDCFNKAATLGQKSEEKAGQRLPLRYEICLGLLSAFRQVGSNFHAIISVPEP